MAWEKLKCRDDMCQYRANRHRFDTLLKMSKRNYYQNFQERLNTANTSDPTEFWNYINKLGPKKDRSIPECVRTDNDLFTDCDVVIDKWKNDFMNLFEKPIEVKTEYNGDFYEHVTRELNVLESEVLTNPNSANEILNSDFTEAELSATLAKLKNGKAHGIDELKNEILKQSGVKELILHLFNFCFRNSIIPSVWRQGILHPIPKSGMKDIYSPLCYRGLMLLCTLEKAYTSLLNQRFVKYCDKNKIINDEQAGFRKTYSCEEQIFNLSTAIRYGLNRSRSTYCCFIDIKKFFDWVDRKLLMFKLLQNNICGKFYLALKSIYQNTMCRVRLNNLESESFVINFGLLQGETFSPSLAGFYLNDLINVINEKSNGCLVGNTRVKILLYADDIVLLSNDVNDLQTQINLFDIWCKDWQITCNLEKTKICISVNLMCQDAIRLLTLVENLLIM